MPGGQEILLLFGLALLLFGPNKIPELARAFGKATAEYKKGMQEVKKAVLTEETSPFTSEEKELITAAKKLGIPTESRSMEEIASDLVNYSEE